MKHLLENMLSLQDKMNTKVHPQWRQQGFSWYRAVWTECAELMDHHGWKWWKKQNPDTPQIRLEIVDIWHFGLSEMLQSGNSIDDIAELVMAQWEQCEPASGDFLSCVEALALHSLTTKSFSVPLFCQLMSQCDYSINQLYRQYIGKNVLNFFRQDHGYKEGHYIKVWQGKEDNEHLAEILDILDTYAEDFQDAVYCALEHRYPHQ